MPRIRPFVIILGAPLILAVVVAGCGGADEPDAKAAAQQAAVASNFQIMSPNFTEIRPRVRIPPKHTCIGEDTSPSLSWSGVPPGTVSLALIADDPANHIELWGHWVLYNIPPDVTGLPEAVPTTTDVLPDGTMQGINDFRRTGYGGPCPPPNIISCWDHVGEPAHKYYFKLYALDAKVGLAAGATKEELLDAMDDHILAEVQTVGKFIRPPQRPDCEGPDASPTPGTATPAQ